MRVAPVFPLVAALALGIAAGPHVPIQSPALIALAAALLAVAAVALIAGSRRRPVTPADDALAPRRGSLADGLASTALLAALVAIGALRAVSDALPADHIARRALPTPVTLEARLLAEPIRWAPDRMRLLVAAEAYRDGADRIPLTGRVQLTVYGEAQALGEGQRIAADVRLHRPTGFRNPGGFDHRAQLRREGILVVGHTRGDRVEPLGPDVPPWPVAVKRWAVETIKSRLPDTSGALLGGLLLGDRASLPRETDDAFRRAGVYHLLAVSGFNVALLASSVFAALGMAGVPRRLTAVAAAVVLVGFAAVVGGQPSVLRATVMGLLLLASVLLERETQVVNALALAALVLLLWRPTDLADPGFLLSFAATAGIVYLAGPIASWLSERGWPSWLAAAVGVSLGAQLGVTPVMASYFNQLSVIGVVANLFVVPLAGPATTLGMLALLTTLASELVSDLLFQAVWAILIALRLLVHAAAAVPGAMVHLPAPAWGAIAAWYGALFLLPHGRARRGVPAATAALVAVLLGWSIWPWIAASDGRLRVIFLDVGQGDATLVELPDGQRLLVDGGTGGARRFDVGERVLSPVLWNRPARHLDVVALSHSDVDHAGGLAAILGHFAVGEFWETGWWSAPSEETRRALERSGAPRRVLRAGDRLWMGHALVTVLNPDAREPVSQNDASLVLRVDWGAVSLLLTGDIGAEGEARLIAGGQPLRALALKVAHHGSRSSSTGAFLDAVEPAIAIVSVGGRNPFRHPSPEALARLEAAGARIYRTDRDGAVILETDGLKLWITRWATGATDVIDLDPERPVPERTTTPGLDRGS